MFTRMRGLALVLGLALLAAACGAATAGENSPTDRSSASFVGLTVDEAGDRAEQQGRPWRIIRLDGEDLAVTDDFSPTRLNLTVQDGIVTAAATDAEMVTGGDSGIAPGEPDRASASFVGLTLDEAAIRAGEQNRPWRTVRLDGEDLAVTADYVEDRLNFTVEDGIVTAAVTDAEMVNGGDSGIAPGEPDRASASFVGLTLDEAGDRAGEQNRPWRTVRLDGEDLAVTADYVEDRLNFTVEDGIVTAAVTDAEMVAMPHDAGCSDEPTSPGAGAFEILGRQDIDGDGDDEVLVLVDGRVGMWTRLGEGCELTEVTLEGSPARFPIGLDNTGASGLSCHPDHVNDLYVVTLTSTDGALYGGRIVAYDLMASELIEAGGEGAELDRSHADSLAGVDCGGVQHP